VRSTSCSPPGGWTTRPRATPRDDIQAELDRLSASSDVERELAAIKGALPAGSTPRAIGTAKPAERSPFIESPRTNQAHERATL
jgi:hypothetical protein